MTEPDVEENRSEECWKNGAQFHRRCASWGCECDCHDERDDG